MLNKCAEINRNNIGCLGNAQFVMRVCVYGYVEKNEVKRVAKLQ